MRILGKWFETRHNAKQQGQKQPALTSATEVDTFIAENLVSVKCPVCNATQAVSSDYPDSVTCYFCGTMLAPHLSTPLEDLIAAGDLAGLVRALDSRSTQMAAARALKAMGPNGVSALHDHVRRANFQIAPDSEFEFLQVVYYESAWMLFADQSVEAVRNGAAFFKQVALACPRPRVGVDCQFDETGKPNSHFVDSLLRCAANTYEDVLVRAKAVLWIPCFFQSGDAAWKRLVLQAISVKADEHLIGLLEDSQRDVRAAAIIMLWELQHGPHERSRVLEALRVKSGTDPDAAVRNLVRVCMATFPAA